MITSPTGGETVSSPVLVTGISNPTFEQHLGIQVIGADGTVIGEGAATISADWGQRGNFEAEVTFASPPGDEAGRIIVFDASPRDGGLVHLSSVEVTLAGA
ncbi:MAG: Gmad2 immunoglobulin-like domain-containing protein [Anaerolineae bacterium]